MSLAGSDLPITAANELRREPIPLSALQHAVYCPRQAALIHLERMWAENRFTAEGHVLHLNADKSGSRRVRGVRRVNALPLYSKRLGIAGVADLVEFYEHARGAIPVPVEIKRGRAKLHRADDVQLCAQALCLEEMMGVAVPIGAIFYAATKRRVSVTFDAELRRMTEGVIAELRQIFDTLKTPPPTSRKERCTACSLIELCRPAAATKAARVWRSRMVDRLLRDVGSEP